MRRWRDSQRPAIRPNLKLEILPCHCFFDGAAYEMSCLDVYTAMDRVAATFVVRSDGAALLQHRDDKPGLRHANMWGPPGGHIEPGELIDDCARRELYEESGYEASELKFLMSFENAVEGCPTYQLTIFWCWYDGIQSIACNEGQALDFITRSTAGNYAIPDCIIHAWDAALAAAGVTTEKYS